MEDNTYGLKSDKMKSNITSWLVRSMPHDINREEEFKEKGIIAVGWPGIGSVAGLSIEEIKEKLSSHDYYKDAYKDETRKLNYDANVVYRLCSSINKGDIVVTPSAKEPNDIFIGIVTSDYNYIESLDDPYDKDGGYPHQRDIDWIVYTKRNLLEDELRSSLRAQNALADLDKHTNTLLALIEEENKKTLEAKQEEDIQQAINLLIENITGNSESSISDTLNKLIEASTQSYISHLFDLVDSYRSTTEKIQILDEDIKNTSDAVKKQDLKDERESHHKFRTENRMFFTESIDSLSKIMSNLFDIYKSI